MKAFHISTQSIFLFIITLLFGMIIFKSLLLLHVELSIKSVTDLSTQNSWEHRFVGMYQNQYFICICSEHLCKHLHIVSTV